MRPFRNTGWPHFTKIQDIVPVGAGARGRHVYRPSKAQLLSSDKANSDTENREAIISGSTIVEGSTATANTVISESESHIPGKDHIISPPTSIASKRTHSTMSADSNEPSRADSQASIASSTHALSPDPINKKQMFSRVRDSSNSSRPGSRESNSAKLGAKVSQATAIIGMQGTINQLTGVFRESMLAPVQDDTMLRRKEALKVLQGDDGLSVTEKARMAFFFQKDISFADTYVSLDDPLVRKEWITLTLANG